MALFFDSEWFDAKLKIAGLSRATLAAALGLGDDEIADIWKDQREISAREVALIAALLGVSAKDVATYAGVSTPVPLAQNESAPTDDARMIGNALRDLSTRLCHVETTLDELKALLTDLKRGKT
ncbi:MAG TPA: helix-turn-helix transcriptional regulator [Rhizomicrobium sp.]|nr:helix-turn-helix transcriptional regulator [Rhizomicrobium sp.]